MTAWGESQDRSEIRHFAVFDAPPMSSYGKGRQYRPESAKVSTWRTGDGEVKSSVQVIGRLILKSGNLGDVTCDIPGLWSRKDWPEWLAQLVAECEDLYESNR